MSLDELKPHLFTSPENPDWIPYRTLYYKENWGFCLSHSQMLALKDGIYEVCIDSTLGGGRMFYHAAKLTLADIESGPYTRMRR